MKSLIALIMGVIFVACAANVMAGENWKGKIYWTIWGENKIVQANYDGSNRMLFARTDKYPIALIVDEKKGIMYWANNGRPWRIPGIKGSIQRCQMEDCLNTTITIVEPRKIVLPYGLTLDGVNGYLYWSDREKDLVQRSKLDGSDIETVLVLRDERKLPVQPVQPEGCKIDEENGVLYWSEKNANRIGRIKLANLRLPYSPKESDYIVTKGLDSPTRIVIDKSRHKLFIAERFPRKISWVSLDGGIPNKIVNAISGSPTGLALDSKTGKIFFTTIYPHEIKSVNVDGTGLKNISDKSGAYPMGMFFVPKSE